MTGKMHKLCLFVTLCFATLVTVDCENVTSNIDHNLMGMGVFFDMVNSFLGDVVHKEKISDSFLNLSTIFVDGELKTTQLEDWKEWANYLIGFAVCVAIGILFIIIMPLVGCIFCCCRCCGRCGARRKVNESKRAKCKRRSYCTILLVLNTVALAGIICSFVCNSLIYKAMQNEQDEGMFGHLKSSVKDVEEYINGSVQHVSDYVIDEFDDASTRILKDVNASGVKAVDDVLTKLNVTQLIDSADKVSAEANRTLAQLNTVNSLLGNLKNVTDELTDNLTTIRENIKTICDREGCSGFNVDEYKIVPNFASLEGLQEKATEVAKATDMQNYINDAKMSLEDAKQKAAGEVQKQTDDAKKAIADVRVEIKTGTDDLKKQVQDNLLDKMPEFYSSLDDASDGAKKYSEYVFYGGIGVCCAYLLICVLYYMGVLYGLCGERPGDGAPCCNTGTGSNFLIAGVAFTFILSWILMIICVILFAIGGPAFTEICRYFNDHDPNALKALDDALINSIDFKDIYTNVPSDLSFVRTIQDCKENKALFSALNLDSVVNLDDIMNTSTLNVKLDELRNANINVESIDIISSNLEDKLKTFANSGLENVNFTEYFVELNKSLVGKDLKQLAMAVDGYASEGSKNEADKATLRSSAHQLRQLNEETIPKINTDVRELNTTLTELQKSSTLKDQILALIDDLNSTQTTFNRDKVQLVKDQIDKLAGSIIADTDRTVAGMKREIRTNMFRCQQLSTSLYTMSDSVCILVLDPVNGLWFGFGWALFFFVPCLIFAVLLASQYRREHKYEKEFDDPNYLMYGGPNHDTIPLTSVDQPPRHSHGQPYPPGMSNAGYSHESKRNSGNMSPPAYDDLHNHQGIAAYAPPKYNGHQHHDLANAYPPAHQGGGRMGGGKNSYSYPY